jgi:hypothetical protein
MKTSPLLLAGLLFTGGLGAGAQALSAQEMARELPTAMVVSRLGNYCHMKFPAIEEDSLGGDHPSLKRSDSGDLIDFYGPCNYDPLGKDEVQAQLMRRKNQLYSQD